MRYSLKTIIILLLFLFIMIVPLTTIAMKLPQNTNYCSPNFFNCTLIPSKVQLGDEINISTSIFDFFGVENVEAQFFHENGFDLINLTQVSGSNRFGTWQGTWKVHDTKIKEYYTIVTAISNSGLSSSKKLTWEDPAPWWDMDWNYRKLITLSSSQVPSDQTNIPLLINITDTDLRDKALSNGNDIAFSDSSGNQLNHEIETYTSGTGNLIAWVNVTSLTSSTDTEIYMYYGNSGASNQENAAGVWDSNYIAVWHLDETSGTHYDSTSNDHDSSSVTGVTQNAIGKIDGGDSLDGTNDYIDITMNIPSTVTISAWARSTASSLTDMLWCIHNSGTGGPDLFFYNNKISLNTWNGDGNPFCDIPADVDEWHLYSTVITSGDTELYIDNQLVGTADYEDPTDTSFAISSSNGYDWQGSIDEFRISSTARSANFIKTQYNNVNNASDGGFYTVGSEEVATPTAPTLTSPSNNGYTNDITPTFEWTVGDNAVNNTFILDDESDLTDGDEWINISLGASTSSYTVNSSKNLSEGRWYWKVIANNSQGSNSSDVGSFYVDTTPPLVVSLSSPANNYSTDSSSVTFSWSAITDNTTNTSQVSNISYYQLQVDDNSDFSSPTVDEDTTDNETLSLTKTVTGQLYWRVRAWDQAGNAGAYSTSRNLTVFSYSMTLDSSTLQIRKGNSGSVTLNISLVLGDVENITLSSDWTGDNQPSNVAVSFSIQEHAVSFDSTITFNCDSSSTTGTFTCRINGTSSSGINRSVNVTISVFSMLFSLDAFPRTISLIRSDSTTATISVEFDQGTLETVTLSGSWVGSTPTGVSISFSLDSGTPSFDSTLTITTSSSAQAGDFVYRVTGTASGLTKTVNLYIGISTNMTITTSTDSSSYEKGQNIQISGTAKDPNGNSVSSGTATIQLSSQDWSTSFTTSISSGLYSTTYYIAFDKPNGAWTVSVTATDSRGHVTSSAITTTVTITSPEVFEHYYINILSPTTGQLFKRGDTISFSISLENADDDKIQNAEVKAYFSNGEEIIFSEGSSGVYSVSYSLGYDSQIGNWKLYVEGKKIEDGKLKVGFNYIDFTIQSIKPVLEIIEPKAGDLIEIGESIIIKIKAAYPDGTPVKEGVITVIGPDGNELTFKRTKEAGVYIASYTVKTSDIGEWAMELTVEDAYGNSAVLNVGAVKVVNSRVMTLIIRYWWATIASIICVATLLGFMIQGRLRITKLSTLEDEISELENLKKKNAVIYFSDGEITRETYDRLFQEYESKIALLSKKQRLLKKKIDRNKSFKRKTGKKK